MTNIKINTLQPSQIKFCGKIMHWKLRNASIYRKYENYFWTNVPRKTQLGKIGATVMVFIIMQQ